MGYVEEVRLSMKERKKNFKLLFCKWNIIRNSVISIVFPSSLEAEGGKTAPVISKSC
jgi:hypothetical protein